MRRTLSRSMRLKLFEDAAGRCYLCGFKIQAGQLWEVEHRIPLALGGADDEANMAPAHKSCHAPKTAEDFGRIAKAKRQKAKHFGMSRSANPMPGSRASKWKRLMDGTVVLR